MHKTFEIYFFGHINQRMHEPMFDVRECSFIAAFFYLVYYDETANVQLQG
jgi:hypothetical protein